MPKVAVLTLSDRGAAGEREDKSGPEIEKKMQEIEGDVEYYNIIPDDKNKLRTELIKLSDELDFDLIFTTGGTGLAPRDITPDVTKEIIEREVPGIAETMRWESIKKTPHAMLSRAVVGVRKRSLIINLPGSPKAVRECLDVILPALAHAVDLVNDNVESCGED